MKLIFRTGLLAMVMLFPAITVAQQFERYYPTTYDRTARDIWRTANNEYLIVGMSNNASPIDSDLYVLLTDDNGQFIWDTVYGGSKPDYAYHMVATDDGNYIVVGYTQSFGAGDLDIYLLKLDPKGKKLAERAVNFGGKNEEARQVIKTSDNKYLVVGTTGIGSTTSKSDVVILKLNNDLTDAAPAITIDGGGNDNDYGLAIAHASDGGYLVGGQTKAPSNGLGDALVIKLKSDLSVDWKKNYGDAFDEEVVGIVGNADGTAMLAIRDSVPNGNTQDGNIDVDLLKIDASGTALAQPVKYGGADKDTPKSIMPVSTGGYIVGAISRSWWNGYPQMWLIRTDADGAQTWIQDYGHLSNHDHCHMIKESHDGGFIAVGHQRLGVMRLAFLKLNAEGYVGLGEETVASGGIFPNPCTGKFSFTCDRSGEQSLEVADIMGRSVLNRVDRVTKGTRIDVELPSVPAGIYIVNIKSENTTRSHRLVIGN